MSNNEKSKSPKKKQKVTTTAAGFEPARAWPISCLGTFETNPLTTRANSRKDGGESDQYKLCKHQINLE